MDFFGNQLKARRAVWMLAVLFCLATAFIIIACNLAITLVLALLAEPRPGAPIPVWNPSLFMMTALVIGVPVALISLIKTVALFWEGGAAVAENLGGRHIMRSTTEADEQRLVNVVDEMAIAAGIPALPVFVLDDENSINAFAAGGGVNGAVIAVTRGALKELTRDEMQAVIGHELSHIINGDTRLNFWVTGVLSGILSIHSLGCKILDPRERISRFSITLGFALVTIGYFGHLLAEAIKGAMCRQTEYQADAASVQFTRNPEALVGLMTKISFFGSHIRHPLAEEASHIFFAPGHNQWLSISTHPPLIDRIRQIEPDFDEGLLHKFEVHIPDEFEDEEDDSSAGLAAKTEQGFPTHLLLASTLVNTLPACLMQATRHTDGARQCVAALLLSPAAEIRAHQSDLIQRAHGDTFLQQVLSTTEWIAANGPQYRLLVLDLSLPTLAELPLNDQRQAMNLCNALINADAHTSVFEQVVRRLLRAHLPSFAPRISSRVSEDRLAQDVAVLLSALLSPEAPAQEQAAAWTKAQRYINLDLPKTFPATSADAASLNDALDHLAGSLAKLRKQVLEACEAVVMHDRQVSPTEAEVLRAIAQALSFPSPPEMHYASALQGQRKMDSD